MFVCCECCVLRWGFCYELITRPEESYRLWCVVMCDLGTSWKRRTWPTGRFRSQKKQTRIGSTQITVLYATLEQPIQGDSEGKVNILGSGSHFDGLNGRKWMVDLMYEYVWPCTIYENDERYQLVATITIYYHK
jgi:hypothetical protein